MKPCLACFDYKCLKNRYRVFFEVNNCPQKLLDSVRNLRQFLANVFNQAFKHFRLLRKVLTPFLDLVHNGTLNILNTFSQYLQK